MTKEETFLKEDLASNIAYLKNGIGQSSDILFQDFSIGQGKTPAMLILTEGLTETLLISDQVVRPLQHQEFCPKQNLIKCISSSILGIKTDQLRTFSEIGKAVLQGNGVLLVEGYSTGLSIEMKKVQQRSLEDPENESMLRGPKVGFIEELRTNTALIRQRANDPNLTIKEMLVGERNEKKIALLFIKGLTDRELVEDMIKRIRNIKIDDPMESGYIEQLIEDYPYSIFPQVQSTERPDRVVSALLEGKIGILLDGTPFATIAPITFNEILQTPDDYYQRWIPSSLLRILRYLSIFITIFLPGLYIAFVAFHPGLLPTTMALAIAGSRQNVPFPPLVEALLMEITIELLREAGLRLPKPIGQTLGLVGGVVIGQAAVQANIVSALMVVIVAVTATASFTIPQYEFSLSLRVLRFINMISASIFGLFGVIMGFLLLIGHLCQLESFKYEFYEPILAKDRKDLRDALLRLPLKLLPTHTQKSKRFSSKKQR